MKTVSLVLSLLTTLKLHAPSPTGPAVLYEPGAICVPTAYVPSASIVVFGVGAGVGSAPAAAGHAPLIARNVAAAVNTLSVDLMSFRVSQMRAA